MDWMCHYPSAKTRKHEFLSTETVRCPVPPLPPGIAALVSALRYNRALKLLDLSFNWAGPKAMRACLDGLVKRQGSAGAPTRWSPACVVKAEVRDAGLPGRPGQEAGVQHSLVARLHDQGRGER